MKFIRKGGRIIPIRDKAAGAAAAAGGGYAISRAVKSARTAHEASTRAAGLAKVSARSEGKFLAHQGQLIAKGAKNIAKNPQLRSLLGAKKQAAKNAARMAGFAGKATRSATVLGVAGAAAVAGGAYLALRKHNKK